MAVSVRSRWGDTSTCTEISDAPARANASMWRSGSTIIRCTSSGSRVTRASASTTGTPMVRFGTKRPSMTSTCSRSAPPASTAATASRRQAKSADRMEGAMRSVTG